MALSYKQPKQQRQQRKIHNEFESHIIIIEKPINYDITYTISKEEEERITLMQIYNKEFDKLKHDFKIYANIYQKLDKRPELRQKMYKIHCGHESDPYTSTLGFLCPDVFNLICSYVTCICGLSYYGDIINILLSTVKNCYQFDIFTIENIKNTFCMCIETHIPTQIYWNLNFDIKLLKQWQFKKCYESLCESNGNIFINNNKYKTKLKKMII